MIRRRDDVENRGSGGGRDHDRTEADMADNGEVTIVGAGARLEGNVVSAGNLRIDGQVKGQINAEGDVSLSPQSQVEADIRAQNVSIAGRFKGSIQVKGKAHLARGGRIDGNITSKTLVVEEGGVFHGQSIMDGAPGTGEGARTQAASSQKVDEKSGAGPAQTQADRAGDRKDEPEVKVP
jgi:cytoskeletal protein CcmA (bactofilin family)